EMAYFAQIQHGLKDENTVLDELLLVDHNGLLEDARHHLARFLFSGDAVFNKVGNLSGGERSRLALAKFARTNANFLLLDEPTNHLDVPSQEILETVLADFAGTILFVSHDRYFIDALATQLWVIEGEQIRTYEGGYQDYLAKDRLDESLNDSRVSPASSKEKTTRKKSAEEDRQYQQQLIALNEQIATQEDSLSQIIRAIDAAILNKNVELLQRLGHNYNQAQTALKALFAKRMQLENRLL
ncbi:MAG: ATP-binding cassette domain-containing protein, partial [Chloroflexota bacterium]